jgi:hypothetical protein
MKLAAVLAVAATFAIPAAAANPPRVVLGIDWNDRTGTRLAQFDPRTLAIQPGRKVLLAGHTSPWAFSPDRTKLALGGDGATLRFVDVRKMRVLGDLRLGAAGLVDYLDWARADRLLVVVLGESGDSTVVLVDAARRRVIRTISIEGSVFGAAAFPGGLVVLLGDSAGRGPAEVAVVDAQGALRTVTVDQISAGYTDYGDGLVEVRRPGLAVDAAAHRAFVVDADFTVAEIDLDGFAVAYHRQSTRSLAKFLPGPSRVARWLGNGVLAVAGANYQSYANPVGLHLIDTRTWTWRVVDPKVASFEVGRGVLAGTDNPFDAAPRHYSVYGIDGSFRYSVDVPALQSLVVQGSYAYVCRGRGLMRVLDARTGAVLHRYRSSTLPLCATLLYGQSSS